MSLDLFKDNSKCIVMRERGDGIAVVRDEEEEVCARYKKKRRGRTNKVNK